MNIWDEPTAWSVLRKENDARRVLAPLAAKVRAEMDALIREAAAKVLNDI